jgi:lipopolysaccharide transport system permease protein
MRSRTFFDLLIFKSSADLRVEVSRYYLNYFWWLLEPVLTMGVFYIVFGLFLNQGAPDFVGFLLIGFAFWNWFVNSVSNASLSILGGQGLMLQVDIPKVFFPLGVVLQDLFKQFFVVALLLVFLLFYHTPKSVTWIALPAIMVVQAMFVSACALLAATFVPFVPDLRYVIGTILNLLMFASGLFFDIDTIVQPQYRSYVFMNPMAGLLTNYRRVLMQAQWPNWWYLLEVSLASLVVLVIAVFILNRLDRLYPRICQQ